MNEAIRALKLTRIIIAHRPETIASADRVVVISGGCVADNGSVIEIRVPRAEAA